MKPIARYLKNRKGINTILAALLMVVIVVVASVMVYAWSTGLLGSLMGNGTQNVGKEALTMENFAFANTTSVTLSIRNAGTAAVSFQAYYIKDNSGNSWQLNPWSPTGQPVNPNSVAPFTMNIGTSSCSSCQYTGTTGQFATFVGGNSYTVQVVTTRNTPFTFTVVK